ncbi:MAG: ABC transporter substrate-binding protein [Chloroflexi bacterium]|nr:ABC transporter substrate-binding protein [Chloroflexota bacterium]
MNLIFKNLRLMINLLFLVSLPVSVAHADGHCDFADQPILIGGVVPLSAPGSVAGGIGMDWGFQQAVADINADCGLQIDGVNHRIRVITADSEGISEFGQVAVERLILQDKVGGIVGFYHSAVGLATMGMVQRYQVPTIYAHPRNDYISASGYIEYEGEPPRFSQGIDFVFRTSPPSSIVGKIVTDWLVDQGVEDVVLILENTDYGHPAAAAERAHLERAGVHVEQLEVELGTEDFVPILSRLWARPALPDAIRILVSGETSYNLTQQMAELGIAPTADTICVTNHLAFQSEQYWNTVPDGNFCAFDRVGTIPSLYNELAEELDRRYQEDFGDILVSFAMEAYDSVWLMADAIERAGGIDDPAAIVAALEQIDIDLSQGHYYFTYGGHNPELPEDVPAYMWHQWPVPVVTVMQYFEHGQSGLEAAVVYPEVYQTHGRSYFHPGGSN